MKVYIITFNDLEIAVDKVYANREQAEKAMRKLIKETDAQAADGGYKTQSHLYGVDELELVMHEVEQ